MAAHKAKAFAPATVANVGPGFDVFGFAVVPDLICYLRIDIENLIPRVIESGGMNYWESGMDLHLGEDLFESFKKYQEGMIKEFDDMAERFNFEVIDARRSVDEIQKDLRAKIAPLLEKKKSEDRPTVVPLKAEGN